MISRAVAGLANQSRLLPWSKNLRSRRESDRQDIDVTGRLQHDETLGPIVTADLEEPLRC